MVHYFLHVQTESLISDDEGGEWPNLQSAREEAVGGLRGIMAERILIGIMPEKESIIIADIHGNCLDIVTVHDAILKGDLGFF